MADPRASRYRLNDAGVGADTTVALTTPRTGPVPRTALLLSAQNVEGIPKLMITDPSDEAEYGGEYHFE
jgi:hypothetical protein